MKKKVSGQLLHKEIEKENITDLECFIRDMIQGCLEKEGIDIHRVALEVTDGTKFKLGFYKPLTEEELKKELEKEQKREAELLEKIKQALEEQAANAEKARVRAEKASEAAKKGWIKRKIELDAQKEKLRIKNEKLMEIVRLKQLEKEKIRAQKELEQAELKRAKEYLKKLLEEDD